MSGGLWSQTPEQKRQWETVKMRLAMKLLQISKATNARFGQLIYNTVANPNDGPCPCVFFCTDEALLDMLNEYGKQLDNPMEEI